MLKKKTIVGVLALSCVAAGVCLFLLRPGNKEKMVPDNSGQTDGLVLVRDGDVLLVDVGKNKMSMADIRFGFDGKPSTFEINRDVFNSELMNQAVGEREWRIVVGVLKATAELPSGKVVLGKFSGGDGINVADGRLTIAGGGEPKELEIMPGELR